MMNKIENFGKLTVASKKTIETTNSKTGVIRTFHQLIVIDKKKGLGAVFNVSPEDYKRVEVQKEYEFSSFQYERGEYTFTEWIIA